MDTAQYALVRDCIRDRIEALEQANRIVAEVDPKHTSSGLYAEVRRLNGAKRELGRIFEQHLKNKRGEQQEEV